MPNQVVSHCKYIIFFQLYKFATGEWRLPYSQVVLHIEIFLNFKNHISLVYISFPLYFYYACRNLNFFMLFNMLNSDSLINTHCDLKTAAIFHLSTSPIWKNLVYCTSFTVQLLQFITRAFIPNPLSSIVCRPFLPPQPDTVLSNKWCKHAFAACEITRLGSA